MTRLQIWLVLLALIGCVGCGVGQDTLRVGTKRFEEQAIVAEVVKQLVHNQAQIRVQMVDCGDTYACQQALASGRIDSMMEYSGTAALYAGVDPRASDLEVRLQRHYGAQAMRWGKGLGFDNGYRLVMAAQRAAALEVSTIEDLSNLDDGIRLACPKTYLRRRGDGLAALLQRYGLRLNGEAWTADGHLERAEAALSGRVDVAVMYATDGALLGTGLVSLTDSLSFFPRYDAALIVREDALRRFEPLAGLLSQLDGRIDNAAMQRMNYQVQVEGLRTGEVAHSFLLAADLVQPVESTRRRLELRLVRARADALEEQANRARLAVRRTFPDRPIKLQVVRDPVRALARGEAKLAVIGAERFFTLRAGRVVRTKRIEALAVLGSRMVHVLRGAQSSAEPLAGRVGIAPAHTGAGRIGSLLLDAVKQQPALRADDTQLVAKLEAGELDAAIIVAEVGAGVVSEALAGGRAQLHTLGDVRPSAAPYLRASRIPARSYEGQPEAIDTLAVQVVLAGPSQRAHAAALKGGPAAAMPGEAEPLSPQQAKLLADATGVAELPDPVLPAAWTRGAANEDELVSHEVVDTVLNALVIVFLGWLVMLVVNTPRTEE
jgi:osmoprotectant transport system substrate-binding protein